MLETQCGVVQWSLWTPKTTSSKSATIPFSASSGSGHSKNATWDRPSQCLECRSKRRCPGFVTRPALTFGRCFDFRTENLHLWRIEPQFRRTGPSCRSLEKRATSRQTPAWSGRVSSQFILAAGTRCRNQTQRRPPLDPVIRFVAFWSRLAAWTSPV